MSSVIVDQRAEATKYIRDKKINKLFDILGAQLARQKPEDPNEFLLNELKRIAELKEKNQPVNQPLFSLAIFYFIFMVCILSHRCHFLPNVTLRSCSLYSI